MHYLLVIKINEKKKKELQVLKKKMKKKNITKS